MMPFGMGAYVFIGLYFSCVYEHYSFIVLFQESSLSWKCEINIFKKKNTPQSKLVSIAKLYERITPFNHLLFK